MTSAPLTDDARQMLVRPNPAVIATTRRDGQPVSAATWYLLRDDQLLVNMDVARKRLAQCAETPGSRSP